MLTVITSSQSERSNLIKRALRPLLVITSALLIFMPTLGNAGVIATKHKLECCTKTSCPTEFDSPGEEGVIQMVVFETEVFPVNGIELPTLSFGDIGYNEWRKKIRAKFDKQTAREIVIASKALVLGKCDSAGIGKVISRKDKSIICPENDGVGVSGELLCKDPSTGPYGKFWLFKLKSEREGNEMMRIIDKIKKMGISLEDVMNKLPNEFIRGGENTWEVVDIERLFELITTAPPMEVGEEEAVPVPSENPEFDPELADEETRRYIEESLRRSEERERRRAEIRERREVLQTRFEELNRGVLESGFLEALESFRQ